MILELVQFIQVMHNSYWETDLSVEVSWDE